MRTLRRAIVLASLVVGIVFIVRRASAGAAASPTTAPAWPPFAPLAEDDGYRAAKA
ncbi:MAG: hypothetical protein ACOYL9_10420 [Ilumatobacteraceae bacterium]|jgi:hypothetical protein